MSLLRRLAKTILPYKTKRWLSSMHQNYYPVPRINISPPVQSAPSPYPNWVASPNPLTELGEKYKPTKRLHNYLTYYWLHFRDIRESVRTVVEIGVESDRSVRMWEEFFPNATIYGVDIDPKCKNYEAGRIKIFIGDQSAPSFLAYLCNEIGAGIDIVIDDGSHIVQHQIATFNYLFPKMSDHGIYVIEDTGGSVDDTRLRTVNRLKTVIDKVFYWPRGVPASQWTRLASFPERTDWLAQNVTGLAFYRWMVFIMRGRNPSDNPYLPVKDDHLLDR